MNLVKKYFSAKELETITDAVRESEAHTAGEIRVEIRQRRSRQENMLSVEQIARNEFLRLGMTNTKDRTGVLIFLLLEEKQFCVLADEGIHAKVGQDPWTDIAAAMTNAFKDGHFATGLTQAVRGVGELLERHVPRKPDDTNELPNTVEIR